MPSGNVDGDDDGRSDETDSDANSTAVTEIRRPRDPMLAFVSELNRTLGRLDRLHARFETFPGRVQLGVAVTSFLSSVYFGPTIKRALDTFVGTTLEAALTELGSFSFGVQLILAILALLVVQITATNETLIRIVKIVETMAGDEITTDGGVRTHRVETTGAWAQGGAGLGAIFGGLFGYMSTIIGGMIFGAIVGNLAEEWVEKRRKRRRLRTTVVEYLLRERVVAPETVERETLRGWFPADDEGFVVEAVAELLRSEDSPVVQQSEGLTLVGASEAVAYLDRNDGRVPSAFAGPDRPPRPSDDGT